MCVCVCVCNHVDLNIFIYKSFYKKKLKNLQDIIVVQMYEN